MSNTDITVSDSQQGIDYVYIDESGPIEEGAINALMDTILNGNKHPESCIPNEMQSAIGDTINNHEIHTRADIPPKNSGNSIRHMDRQQLRTKLVESLDLFDEILPIAQHNATDSDVNKLKAAEERRDLISEGWINED